MQTDQGEESKSDLIEAERKLAENASKNPEEWIDHCKDLVAEYRGLIQDAKSNYYKKEGDVGYLLNMKWLDHWKKCYYFDSLFRNMKPQFDPERPTVAGEIDSLALIRPRHEILADVDEDSYFNYVLKKDLKMNFDYKAVDEETWNFFHSRYGGIPIKRFYHKAYSFGADIEAKLKEFKVICLPTLEDWDDSKILDPISIFCSKFDKFSDLLARIVKNFNSDQYGHKLTEKGIRPWKLAFNSSIKDISKEIMEFKESSSDRDQTMDDEETAEDDKKTVEKNTGIKFHGTNLEMMRGFKIDDVEVSSTDTLVIEQESPKTNKFIFYYEQIKILCYGKCEY